MSAGTLISLEEYFHCPYDPEREFRDGVVVVRNVGELDHSTVETALACHLVNRRKEWHAKVYIALTVRVRENWYPIADVCLYSPDAPDESYPSKPPLLWIEVLSTEDRMRDVWSRAAELVQCGVPYVWIVDPATLESELHTARGIVPVPNKTLRLPNTPIVIPLAKVMEE